MADRIEAVVVDASVLVDLLAGTDYAPPATRRLRGTALHAPAHIDAEVLSAIERLHRAGELSASDAETALARMKTLPLVRHLLGELLIDTWELRDSIRLVGGLYVALAARLDAPLLTTDARLARACPIAEGIVAELRG